MGATSHIFKWFLNGRMAGNTPALVEQAGCAFSLGIHVPAFSAA
jgi:hypothetical protein